MIEVPLNLPTTPPRTVPLIIDILLWNRCGARVSWNIKRKKNCKCELQTVDRYISFRCQEYNCPHRPMLRLSPSVGELEPGTGTLLRMEMRYKIEGDWQLKHVINLPNDRQIMLVSWVQVINPLKPIPICLRNEFQMMDTWYFGFITMDFRKLHTR
ncbi:hypothetical protein C0J52_22997 [Blattella germanica]|nr:hypothetical protein C0J52_22997 [Blattella germanica]